MPQTNTPTPNKANPNQGRPEPRTEQMNEGEGSRTAARRYNKGVESTVKSGKVEAGARKAREALDGPEAEDLKRAEEEAKDLARE
jgi:hypothetical protein